MSHRHASALAGAAAVLAMLVLAPAAPAALDEVNTKKLRDAVTVNGILQHARAFQTIANLNGGNRASGTAGYDASAAYVKERLRRAGYRVTEQEFEFPFFQETAPAEFERISPSPKTYVVDEDFITMEYSGSGDATGDLAPVDLVLPPGPEPSTSNSGCEASDFAGFEAGDIALLQRGTCDFAVKAANAQAAGAAAAIIFNEGQPGRTATLAGTLGGPGITIPVIGTSFAIGNELAGLGDVVVRVATSTESEIRTTTNVLAETREGDATQKVVIGGHLDSTLDGPAINDDGSGTATVLDIAEAMRETKLDRKLRRKVVFAFWGAEENGLLGSEHYVETLGASGIADLYAYLNFDMLGSPNYVRFVFDGDGSDTEPAGPPGSEEIESLFNRYYASQGLATDPTPFSGSSDYEPFRLAGLPVGGLFAGAGDLKTERQAQIYGGTAGQPFDPNYHTANDTVANLNPQALNELSDGAAHATLTLGRSRSGLFADGSRVRGKKMRQQALVGPNLQR
jgi:Zn-dependent M28 family amino/carboxypeptidase